MLDASPQYYFATYSLCCWLFGAYLFCWTSASCELAQLFFISPDGSSEFHGQDLILKAVRRAGPFCLVRCLLSSIHFLILQSFSCGNSFYIKQVRYFWKQPQKLSRLTREKYAYMKHSV